MGDSIVNECLNLCLNLCNSTCWGPLWMTTKWISEQKWWLISDTDESTMVIPNLAPSSLRIRWSGISLSFLTGCRERLRAGVHRTSWILMVKIPHLCLACNVLYLTLILVTQASRWIFRCSYLLTNGVTLQFLLHLMAYATRSSYSQGRQNRRSGLSLGIKIKQTWVLILALPHIIYTLWYLLNPFQLLFSYL